MAALAAPAAAVALEPRFDHRDQQGPLVELLGVRDVVWASSSESDTGNRGAVRAAWGIDPTGDGDELFFGATLMAYEGDPALAVPVRLSVDARYRVTLGTEELKTLLEIGIFANVSERFAAGPLVGMGIMYDFSREFGVFTSAFLGAGAGQGRVVSFGGGVGAQFRYE